MRKKQRQRRKVAIAGHYEENIRHRSYKHTAESIDKRHSGEDKAAFRGRPLDRRKELAQSILEGTLRPSAAAQAKIVNAFRKWAEECEKPIGQHEVLTVAELQMLYSVLPGLDEFFFCRA